MPRTRPDFSPAIAKEKSQPSGRDSPASEAPSGASVQDLCVCVVWHHATDDRLLHRGCTLTIHGSLPAEYHAYRTCQGTFDTPGPGAAWCGCHGLAQAGLRVSSFCRQPQATTPSPMHRVVRAMVTSDEVVQLARHCMLPPNCRFLGVDQQQYRKLSSSYLHYVYRGQSGPSPGCPRVLDTGVLRSLSDMRS